MQGAQIGSLVGELNSHMPCGVAKKKKKERERTPGESQMKEEVWIIQKEEKQ